MLKKYMNKYFHKVLIDEFIINVQNDNTEGAGRA
jgi:hypothetical protein